LSEGEREQLYVIIRQRAVGIGVGCASHEEIDRFNILEATRLAMRRALASIMPTPDCLLIDAVTLPGSRVPIRPIIKGDALCLSIAAASIVAKVTRDRLMAEYHRIYPEYDFLSHKGYGTEEHRQRLMDHGPCAIHRRTFAPVAQSFAPGEVLPASVSSEDLSEWFDENP
jgi:ribonuclease HII